MRTDIEPEGVPADPGIRRTEAAPIRSVDDYERATARATALTGAARNAADERELAALLEAIARWDQRHDDATSWR